MPIVQEVIKVGSGELLIKGRAHGRQLNGQIAATDVYVHVEPTNAKIEKGDDVVWHNDKVTVTKPDGKVLNLIRFYPHEKK